MKNEKTSLQLQIFKRFPFQFVHHSLNSCRSILVLYEAAVSWPNCLCLLEKTIYKQPYGKTWKYGYIERIYRTDNHWSRSITEIMVNTTTEFLEIFSGASARHSFKNIQNKWISVIQFQEERLFSFAFLLIYANFRKTKKKSPTINTAHCGLNFA